MDTRKTENVTENYLDSTAQVLLPKEGASLESDTQPGGSTTEISEEVNQNVDLPIKDGRGDEIGTTLEDGKVKDQEKGRGRRRRRRRKGDDGENLAFGGGYGDTTHSNRRSHPRGKSSN